MLACEITYKNVGGQLLVWSPPILFPLSQNNPEILSKSYENIPQICCFSSSKRPLFDVKILYTKACLFRGHFFPVDSLILPIRTSGWKKCPKIAYAEQALEALFWHVFASRERCRWMLFDGDMEGHQMMCCKCYRFGPFWRKSQLRWWNDEGEDCPFNIFCIIKKYCCPVNFKKRTKVVQNLNKTVVRDTNFQKQAP